ncbi:FAD-dependent oxidoreductase [Polaribacter aquimarinus]|nr:FAD-dependent oxidoreductase [Polaribacter aquimarinus]
MNKYEVVVIGGGYAGLSCALELSKNDVKSILIEKEKELGGLSRTFSIGDSIFDIGPHIYFNKDKEVVKFWKNLVGDKLQTRKRSNSIFYNSKYIKSPLQVSNTLKQLGIFTTVKIFYSFFMSKIKNRNKAPKTSKDWVVFNFGKELYERFFKVYNEKIWGLPCEEVTSNWAGQRIKSSLSKMIYKSLTRDNDFIIKSFDYPEKGSQTIINAIEKEIILHKKCEILKADKIVSIELNKKQKEYLVKTESGKQILSKTIISSIPIETTLKFLNNKNTFINSLLDKLVYRNLVLCLLNIESTIPISFKNQWIDIHDPNVKALRATNYANYDCKMNSSQYVPVSLEYNCFNKEEIWNASDEEIYKIAINDLIKLKVISKEIKVSYKIVKLEKAYPVYFKGYEEIIKILKQEVSKFPNLEVIGRLGMYKWNNMHHSVKTGILVAKNCIEGTNHNLWDVKGMVSIGKEYND